MFPSSFGQVWTSITEVHRTITTSSQQLPYQLPNSSPRNLQEENENLRTGLEHWKKEASKYKELYEECKRKEDAVRNILNTMTPERLKLTDDGYRCSKKIEKEFVEKNKKRKLEQINTQLKLSLPEESDPTECSVCYNPLVESNKYIFPCAHMVCNGCANQIRRVNPVCPQCRHPF